jgi:hypothetical protein
MLPGRDQCMKVMNNFVDYAYHWNIFKFFTGDQYDELKPQYSNFSGGPHTVDNNGWQTESRIDEEKRERINGILKFKTKIHYLWHIENKLKQKPIWTKNILG